MNNDIFCPNESWSSGKILGLCRNSGKEFSSICSSSLPSLFTGLCSYWISPTPCFVKVNCDGSLFPHCNIAGFGCVLRDCHGNWIRGCSGSINETIVLRCEFFGIWHVSKIHDLRNRSWNLSFRLIDRLANGVTDFLAKHAFVTEHSLIEWATPPFDAAFIVNQELSP
ncbi:hypothetical protein PIB30_060961 [Stylosanthes scabra]|uniref:RNase H type-1 domain-containing protein n=1 Tax=Stylosanthes scabra TaxID=79078 RepID=A0ABU6QKF9_9FABA|nr:hypothetical protein [Stylosanthes scabra]